MFSLENIPIIGKRKKIRKKQKQALNTTYQEWKKKQKEPMEMVPEEVEEEIEVWRWYDCVVHMGGIDIATWYTVRGFTSSWASPWLCTDVHLFPWILLYLSVALKIGTCLITVNFCTIGVWCCTFVLVIDARANHSKHRHGTTSRRQRFWPLWL